MKLILRKIDQNSTKRSWYSNENVISTVSIEVCAFFIIDIIIYSYAWTLQISMEAAETNA